MNAERLQELIRRLDAEVPRENARVLFQQYGGGPDEGQIIANETGYLRLGIEFLKAAFAERTGDGSAEAVQVDLEYPVDENSTINFDVFERREPKASSSSYVRSPMEGGRFFPVISIILLASVLGCAWIGLRTIVGWLTD